MTRIAVVGATGYSALELLRLLLRHPHARIAALTSRQEGSPHIAHVHPALTGRLDLRCEELDAAAVAARAEVVFTCLPHGVTATIVPELLAAGARVIDFSADYRLRDAQVYAEWYGAPHADPARLAEAVYGLPELFRPRIAAARLVANPGCYPTAAVLGLAPLLAAGAVEPTDILIDAKSGVSGAGRTPKLNTHFPECNESVSAYNVGRHRHTPEIEQVLTDASGRDVQVVFTPHLVPMDRGILSTAYARPVGGASQERLLDILRQTYAREPFVRVVEHLPATKDTSGTNYCDVTLRVVRGRAIVISCLDNLVKGAAGAAVQNFNVLCGYPEATGLL
jgi:N-acetyl-gamma-glutamyl-phosphate reductase